MLKVRIKCNSALIMTEEEGQSDEKLNFNVSNWWGSIYDVKLHFRTGENIPTSNDIF